MVKSLPAEKIPNHKENTALRDIAVEVSATEFEDGILETILGRLRGTLAENGVGLAAPQIGVSKRVFIMQDLEKFIAEAGKEASADRGRKPFGPYVVVNPKILDRSSEKTAHVEGCLSIPGFAGVVRRHEWIEVEFSDETGQSKSTTLRDWEARVFQHEFDHLEGIFYSDDDRLVEDKFFVNPEPEAQDIKTLTLAQIEAEIEKGTRKKSEEYPDRSLRKSSR